MSDDHTEQSPPQKEAERKTSVIGFGNQKGGVGKTTNCLHIAAALGEMGSRCLIWDLDPNHGATNAFAIPSESYLGTYEVLMGYESPEDVVLTQEDDDIEFPENVHLIPAKRRIENIDRELIAADKFLVIQDILIEPLKKLRGRYDFIFLDTAPSTSSAPTVASYKASDFYVLSAMPEPMATAGLNEAIADIKQAQKRGNPNLILLGVMLCNMDTRTRLAKTLNEYLEDVFKVKEEQSLKFNPYVSRSTVIPRAQRLGKTVFQTDPKHRVTEQYREIAREFKNRIDKLTEKRSASETLSPSGADSSSPRKEVSSVKAEATHG